MKNVLIQSIIQLNMTEGDGVELAQWWSKAPERLCSIKKPSFIFTKIPPPSYLYQYLFTYYVRDALVLSTLALSIWLLTYNKCYIPYFVIPPVFLRRGRRESPSLRVRDLVSIMSISPCGGIFISIR